ncbi:MAG: dihydrolipoyl dehydrogenase [Candidatus Omnitrophica bacterium]|nr:dihydrolipoyl dehydrogenase [Candidatus Omnitrophota bacterium]
MPIYDLAVIGAGPGGFEAALRARELGYSAALIEKSDPGGVCLNTGCIPTKAFLASSRLLGRIRNARLYGLLASDVSAEPSALVARKNQIVATLRKGMLQAIQKSGVEWVSGSASFAGPGRLLVRSNESQREIEAKNILIAAGAAPTPFPGVPFDGKKVLSSTDVLELKTVPGQILIVGGGVIGVEFASFFNALGTEVTVVEMLDRIIATEEEEISRRLESILTRKGIKIRTGEKVTREEILKADTALIAVGRTPNIGGLGLEKAGVKVDRGAIAVDEFLETSTPGIFAIGDVTNRTTGLAHGASAEGLRVVDNLKGPKLKMDTRAIPSAIYTDPEVAGVGLKEGGGEVRPEETVSCKVLFSSLGKAHVEGEPEGFLKMAASPKTGKIVSVSALGAHVTELIGEAALAIRLGLTVKDLAETVHPHPTESEILQKVAQELAKKINF